MLARLLTYPIRIYKLLISPLLGGHCRYLPSCSEYAEEALRSHGAFRGSILAAKRLLRCHPWGGSGFDPVPPCDKTQCRHHPAPSPFTSAKEE